MRNLVVILDNLDYSSPVALNMGRHLWKWFDDKARNIGLRVGNTLKLNFGILEYGKNNWTKLLFHSTPP